MKKITLMLIIMLIFILTSSLVFAQSCTTLGVRDCRAGSGKDCFLWECQQTGSVKQMIFLGIKCACKRSALEDPNLLAQIEDRTCSDRGINQDVMIEAIKACVPEARTQDSQFTAFLNPAKCTVKASGGRDSQSFWAAHNVFWNCMTQNGFPPGK